MSNSNTPSIEEEREFWKHIYSLIIPLKGFSSQESAKHADKAIIFYRKFCKEQDQYRRQEHANKHL